MSRRNNNQNNQYNNQYYGNGQYYNGNGNGNRNRNNQYYNPNQQYYNNPNGQYNNGQYNNPNGQYYCPTQQYYSQSNQNGQQSKFGIAEQEQPEKKKKEKKNLNLNKDLLIRIGLFSLFAIGLIITVVAIRSCNKEEDVPVEYEDEYKVVGNASYGYLTIPGDWVVFKDINAQRGMRYADPDGSYIITMDALSTKEISAQSYALGTSQQLEELGVSDLKGATVKLAGYEAYQVYGYYKEQNKWVLTYFFEAEDDNTHYLGIEGPDKDNEAFRILDTFKLKK